MLLALNGVRKTFGSTVALSEVTCALDGRAVGLVGPNGAGKTTLMKICLGLLAPDRGDVRVLDVDVRRAAHRVRARLGYAAEGPGRLPGLSGLESVAYAGELCGLKRPHALRRAHEILDLMGLDESRHRTVESYSTGMHQRVKLAMALVHDPALLLLDEPTSGLDPESRDDLLDLLVALRRGDGPAVLLSTHLLHDVERTCDACIIMHEGTVRYAGSLEDLRGRLPHRYEIRVRERCDALTAALESRGASVERDRRPEILRVTLPDGAVPSLVWACARETGALVWHLEEHAVSLEQAFLDKISASDRAEGAPA